MTRIPLVFSFWFMLVAYVVHILDESLLGGSFVEKVREHWWPGYSWRKFFWFNAAYLLIMSIVAYDRLGSRFLFLPVAWALERLVNSLWHIWWGGAFSRILAGPADVRADLDAVLLHGVLPCRGSGVARGNDLARVVPGIVGWGVSEFLYSDVRESAVWPCLIVSVGIAVRG